MKDESHEDDAEWFRAIIDRHAGPLHRYASSIVHNGETARDVVQETFVRLWREPRAAVEAHVVAWLFRVCRNRALDYQRKEGRMMPLDTTPVPEQAVETPPPDAATESRDSFSRILHMLNELPLNQREVVRLKFQNGLSYREIADITELSVGNVGLLLHTALKTLRARLAAAGE